jgi:transposase
MAGKSSVVASEEQKRALADLARSQERGEADRARAILLTLAGWTSPAIAEAFGVREDTVRLWRSAFMRGGMAALRAHIPPGPAPIKAERALAVAEDLLAAPVADRLNWTLPRLAAEIERRSGLRISCSHLSVVLRQRGTSAGGAPATR